MASNPATESEFKHAVIHAVLWPTLLVLVTAGVLIWQVSHLITTISSVEHIDRVITQAHLLEKDVIDMETGLRGYLLTGDRTFRQPYDTGLKEFPLDSATLAAMVADDPKQLETQAQIQVQEQDWTLYAQDQIAKRAKQGDYASVVATGEGKKRVDEIRELFARFIFEAEDTRNVRVAAAQRAGRVTFAVSAAFLAASMALIIVATQRRSARLAQIYGKVVAQTRQLNKHLEERVMERTRQLQEANAELEAFSYSVSHDLRAPLRHIAGFVDLIQKSDASALGDESRENLETVAVTARRAGQMVDALLAFSRLGRTQMRNADVDMNQLVRQIIQELEPETRDRDITWRIDPLPSARGDEAMLKIVLHNLLANAVKYTSKRSEAVIEVGSRTEPDGRVYFVRDNGAGFDARHGDKLFGVFQRLHREEEFEGTGIGLADVKRIILRHKGRVWAEGTPNQGAAFYFSLPGESPAPVKDERRT